MSLWLKWLFASERYWYAFIALAVLVLFVDARLPNGPLAGALAFLGGAFVASGVIGTMKSFSKRKRPS